MPRMETRETELVETEPSSLATRAAELGLHGPRPLQVLPATEIASRNTLRNLARTHTRDAVNLIAAYMNDEKQSAKLRVDCAQIILDRGWGRAEQALVGADGGDLLVYKEVSSRDEALAILGKLLPRRT